MQGWSGVRVESLLRQQGESGEVWEGSVMKAATKNEEVAREEEAEVEVEEV